MGLLKSRLVLYVAVLVLTQAMGTFTTSTRLGPFPTFTRATSRRVEASMIEQSLVSLLLTAQYLPSGEHAIQLGHFPT
jgi:hypothetical protein